MPMTLAVALGGAVGAVFRFWLSRAVYGWFGSAFPWGTLSVNVLGSLIIGFLSVLLIDRLAVAPEWRSIILVGGIGSFTTFSTFSLETIDLLRSSGIWPALANVGGSVILGLLACACGLWLGRQI